MKRIEFWLDELAVERLNKAAKGSSITTRAAFVRQATIEKIERTEETERKRKEELACTKIL